MANDHDCGCGKSKPQAAEETTRREFIQGVATAGIGITAALATGTAPVPASADVATGVCADLLQRCLENNCEQESNPIRAGLCRLQCNAEYHLCQIQEMLRRLGDAMREGLEWLRQHPEVVIGTIIVIGGIALIVTTGPGGAAVLAFA